MMCSERGVFHFLGTHQTMRATEIQATPCPSIVDLEYRVFDHATAARIPASDDKM